MPETKPSIEELDALFAEESDKGNEPPPRLLKERGLSSGNFEELKPVPYYKKPSVQFGVAVALAIPTTWLLFTSFFPSQSEPQISEADQAQVREKQRLQESLEQERKKNQDLIIEKGLRSQHKEIEVIPVKKIQSPPKPLPPPPRTLPPPRPPAVRPISMPPPRVRERIPPPPKPIARSIEPEVDPMERWLAEANRGYYVASSSPDFENSSSVEAGDISSNPNDAYAEVSQSQTANLSDLYSGSNASQSVSPESDSGMARQPSSTPVPYESQMSSHSNDALTSYPSDTSQYPNGDSQPQTLRQRDRTGLEENNWRTTAIETGERTETMGAYEQRQYEEDRSSYSPNDGYANSPLSGARVLDLGSSAEASLETGIAWAEQGTGTDRNYLLRLEEGFTNSAGQEILPSGTRLIVRVAETSNSGLFFLEVTHILLNKRQRIPVPPGALQVVSDDGSPLKADKKQKGGSDFGSVFGALAVSGVESAMDSVAGGADRLIFDDGGISTSGGSRDPVAAGISGVASGAGEVLNRQLDRGQDTTEVPYFEFDSGETVRVIVNEDFSL